MTHRPLRSAGPVIGLVNATRCSCGLHTITLFDGSRLLYGHRMGTAGQFIVEIQRERRMGNVSSETEQHLKHEFRTLGRDASESVLAAAVGSEIDRLSKEAETLRKLRAVLFGVA